MKKEIHVIPTTHWDRDWYWPFERFRVKLIEMWTRVKEMWEVHSDYHFFSDGQTICIEDYLEIFPEDRELFAQRGREGRLSAGPLYVQSDTYCTGGEAFIRNLLIGRQQAKALHAETNVLVMPDVFGHIPSMPMILKGFGIDTYVYMRGVPKGIDQDDRMWWWEAEDGSRVQVFRLRDGYGNGARLGLHKGSGEIMDSESSGIQPIFSMEMALAQINKASDKQCDRQGPPYVLHAGVDHQIPQKELMDIMTQSECEHHHYRISNWDEVANLMRSSQRDQWSVGHGEIHGSGAATSLGGTVSSRAYLKLENANAERILAHRAESMAALLRTFEEVEFSEAMLENSWRRLLKVHPHDDITGCSVDTVHRENEGHLAAAQQAGLALEQVFFKRLISRIGGQKKGDERLGFMLFNPQCQPLKRIVNLTIDCEGRRHWGDIKLPEQLKIVDESGLEIAHLENSRSKGSEHPHAVLKLELFIDLKAWEIKRFFIEPKEKTDKVELSDGIENERWKLTVDENGVVSLKDKVDGSVIQDICFFTDQADVGDEYDFSHIHEEQELKLSIEKLNIRVCGQKHGIQSLVLSGMISVPLGVLDGKRMSNMVSLPIKVTYLLAPGQEPMDVHVVVENLAKDHRLRLNIPLTESSKSSTSGLKFTTATRPSLKRRSVGQKGSEFVIDPIYVADTFVAINDREDGGSAIFSEAPFNYEICHDPWPRLAITLFRCVGMLSHASITRGGGAGPETPTPEAQCLGRKLSYRFSFLPYKGIDNDQLFRRALLWRQQPCFGLIPGITIPPTGEDPCVPQIDASNEVIVSSIKPPHDRKRKGWIMRLHNTSMLSQVVKISPPSSWTAQPCGLHEEALGEVLGDENSMASLELLPRSLYSIWFYPND